MNEAVGVNIVQPAITTVPSGPYQCVFNRLLLLSVFHRRRSGIVQ